MTCADSIFVFRKKISMGGLEALQIQSMGTNSSSSVTGKNPSILFFPCFYCHSSYKLVLLNLLLRTVISKSKKVAIKKNSDIDSN